MSTTDTNPEYWSEYSNLQHVKHRLLPPRSRTWGRWTRPGAPDRPRFGGRLGRRLARGYEAITSTADWRTIEPAQLALAADPATPSPSQRAA